MNMVANSTKETALADSSAQASPQLQSLLEQLMHLSTTQKGASDVTAFMTFLGHWISRRFESIDIQGLEHVSNDQSHLFISNHRDILLDVVLINHALLNKEKGAARAIIGSNLMEDPAMSSLMSLAGCIVVPRGEMPLKQKFLALKDLSNTLCDAQKSSHLWIAQREGRTKDGIDQTNPAILKMLSLAREKEQPLSDFLNEKNITPVAISYEWDPSDTHKAMENHFRAIAGPEGDIPRTDGIKHLIDSLESCAGRVTVRFGKPLEAKENNEIASLRQQMDQFLLEKYRLYSSHQAAARKQAGEMMPPHLLYAFTQLQRRCKSLPKPAQEQLFNIYSNSFHHYSNSR